MPSVIAPTASYNITAPPECPLGSTVPFMTPHAVSVSLPKWADNVDYEEGHERIKQAMTSGYPRFFIHHQIEQLAKLVRTRFGRSDELCILLPTRNTAKRCQAFLLTLSPPANSRIIEWTIQSNKVASSTMDSDMAARQRTLTLFACFASATNWSGLKQYWQHTGEGISSRMAERCLSLLGELDSETSSPKPEQSEPSPTTSAPTSTGSDTLASRYGSKSGRYAVAKPASTSGTATPTTASDLVKPPMVSSKSRYSTSRGRSSQLLSHNGTSDDSEASSLANSVDSLAIRRPSAAGNGFPAIDQEEDVLARYVEERYGRNLDLSLAPLAKLAMRRRIAGVLRESPGEAIPIENMGDAKGKESTRGVTSLTEDDVWLYPGGMSAIFHAHQLAMGATARSGKPVGKSVCFGFPYTDTLKILEKWGPGCHFFGHGLTSDLPALRKTLQQSDVPVLALFCEFPSNPLLRTPPLQELRKLADEYGFMIVVDETIAGFVNVEVLPPADIVVSSLTKVFSGDSNVMGGSLVLNPNGPFYAELKAEQEATFEDFYFDEDAIYMERNSRDFQERVAAMNLNAETVCELLRSRRAPAPSAVGVIDPPITSILGKNEDSVLKEVYYPKYMTPDLYLAQLRPSNPELPNSSGFSALFSLTFTSILASRVFFDALPCYKGPSLGTNFTIACPYTILAHYTETDWAAEYGVEKGLVRISIGLEDTELLKEWFTSALDAAEKAEKDARDQGLPLI
ncbi:Cystathionine gamma-synthase [Microbotryomycetes sp. JL221]|nr:Cystathionine gamma-synthase [Microbotryomycetes sp. JL221]